MKRIGLTAILLCCLLGMTSCQKEESVPWLPRFRTQLLRFFVHANPNADSYA